MIGAMTAAMACSIVGLFGIVAINVMHIIALLDRVRKIENQLGIER